MTVAEIWEVVKERVSETLPDCEVIREYDLTQRLKSVANQSQPLVIVGLERTESRAISQKNIEDNHIFSVTILKSLDGLTDSEAKTEADACLEMVPNLQRDIFLKGSQDGLNQDLKLMSINSEGNFFETEFFQEENVFAIGTILIVKHFRQFN